MGAYRARKRNALRMRSRLRGSSAPAPIVAEPKAEPQNAEAIDDEDRQHDDDLSTFDPTEAMEDHEELSTFDQAAAGEDEEELSTFDLSEAEDDEPPFDPPDIEEQDLLVDDGDDAALDLVEEQAKSPSVNDGVLELRRQPDLKPVGKAAPAISVHVSWDRSEAAELAAAMAGDGRMARALVTEGRGGLESAITRFALEDSPDLLIVDTTLTAAPMLAALERLKSVLKPDAKIIMLGAINDVPLLRELMRRGVSQYMLTPVAPAQLIDAICALYAQTDNSRVLAVVGARGGVGASTLAFNLAWCIAENRQAATTLVDLDLSFGASAFGYDRPPGASLAEGLADPSRIDDDLLERATVRSGDRLRVLPAPASLDRGTDFDAQALQALIEQVRRTSAFIILDLPHAWTPWVKHALAQADEVLVVAAPDLASMRNAKNLLDALKSARPPGREPVVALSMVGAPKRPEISSKEFSDAIGAVPAASLAFDPGVVALAELKGLAIGEIAPNSKSAANVDALAGLLTGLKPRPAAARAKAAARQAPAPVATNKAPRVEIPAPAIEPASDVARNEPAPAIAQAAPQALEPVMVLSTPAAAAPRRPRVRNVVARAKRGRGRPGTIRAAAALVALAIAGGSYLQTLNGASASPSPALVQPAAATAATPPPPPVEVLDPQTQYESALRLIGEGAPAEGAELLRLAAERGHAAAQYRLAKLYETGEGVTADLAAARSWTERAAAAGDGRAMHDLGVYYAGGEAGPRDEAAAYRWFRQAAEFDIAASQYNLGLLYEQGRGVTANAEEALFWFLVAARQGDEAAAARAAVVEELLLPEEIGRTQARAQAFVPRTSATQGSDAAD